MDLEYLESDILPKLRRHIAFKLRFSGQDEIENIVQETIVRIIQNDALERGMAWAYTVANNLIADHFRVHGRLEPLPGPDIIPNTKALSEHQILVKAAFDEAFRQLSEEEQRCLYLDAIGNTDAEIAEETELPLTTVAFRLKTARQKIRDNPKFAGLYSQKAKRQ